MCVSPPSMRCLLKPECSACSHLCGAYRASIMALCMSHGLTSFRQIRSPVGSSFRPPCTHVSFRRRDCIPRFSFRACAAIGSDHGVERAPQASAQAAKFKEELVKAIDEAEQGLDEKCLGIIASLEQLGEVPDFVAHPHLLKGRLVGLKTKFKENRVDGKQRHLSLEGSPTTLGPTTFFALKPPDLEIFVHTGYQHVAMESPDSYVLFVDVDVVNPGSDKPLAGQIANKARFSIQGPHSLDIEFVAVEIKPKFPERDLESWLKIFKEANPDMDDNGLVSVFHKNPIKGRTDILYMDDEIRIHRGHKGGVSVLGLLKDPI